MVQNAHKVILSLNNMANGRDVKLRALAMHSLGLSIETFSESCIEFAFELFH